MESAAEPAAEEEKEETCDANASVETRLGEAVRMNGILQGQVEILAFKVQEMPQLFFYSDSIALKNFAILK